MENNREYQTAISEFFLKEQRMYRAEAGKLSGNQGVSAHDAPLISP